MKERDLNLELCRIIAMFLVLTFHTILGGIGVPETDDFLNDLPYATIRLMFISLSCICVNTFIMVSGWHSIKFTYNKLLNIGFQVIFWNLISLCFYIIVGNDFYFNHITRIFCLDGQLWFVISYIFLMIISPILNNYIDTASNRELKRTIITFYIFQTIVGWGFKIGHFDGGFSPLSFIGLYLLARYIHKYPNRMTTLPPICDISIYLICSIFITIAITYFALQGEYIERLYMYISPIVIVSSLYFFLFFTKVKFSKFKCSILYFSSSAFAVYLFHDNKFIVDYFQQTVRSIYNNGGVFALSISLAALFLVITTIDKIRILLWKGILSITTKKRTV